MAIKSRKIAIMGFRAVGKSSLAVQFAEDQFVDSYNPTIENTFRRQFRHRGQEYSVEVVDTAGQDEFSIFPHAYTVDIEAYILVYSVISVKSFDVVRVIHDKLLDQLGTDHVPLVLVGNKIDLRMERVVSEENGRELALKWKAAFLETSAKRNEKVKEVFLTALDEIEKKMNPGVDKDGDCIIL
ncbi:GTP-binding protein Rheb-like [Oscarella lobularis]|uniref:GTP-binding protein Rheb-like n=1 Tax=Oscarella lobularis TaxID=121494 RepID=UPI003313FD45